MILNTITLHNFMSYGDATVDMTSFSIACLSGLNGAGKSAILDAVTWALWESARSTSDELVRTGEQEMWVDLCFELEGNLYRVRRSRQRTSPRAGSKVVSKGTLEFQIWSGDSWTSLTCASMRETQLRICDLLRMDYDTFINSVYLRQGRADEFTTRAPAERKQVLAEILGLNYFDKLQELAREQSRRRKAEADVLQGTLKQSSNLEDEMHSARAELKQAAARMQDVCAQLSQRQLRLATVLDELSELLAIESRLEPTRLRLDELHADVETLTAARDKVLSEHTRLSNVLHCAAQLEESAAEFEATKARVEKLDQISLERQEFETRRMELKSSVATMRGRMEVELEHLHLQLQALEKTRESLQKETSAKDKIDKDYADYKKLLAQEADMARRQESFVQLSNRAEQLHTIVVEARIFLEAELEQKERTVGELRSLIECREKISQQQTLLQSRSEELDRLETEFELVEDKGLKLKQEIDATNLQVKSLEKRLAENSQKVHELQHAESLTMCPLCAAPIVDRTAVIDRYSTLDCEIHTQIDELCLQAEALESKRAELRVRYTDLRKQLDGRKKLDVQIGEFNARMAALERADINYTQLITEIADIKEKLEKQTYAPVERESLISIKAECHKLEFDPVLYSSLQAQLRKQRHVEMRYQQLRKDQAELERTNQEIPQLAQRIEKLHEQLQNDNFAADVRVEIDELSERLAGFDYDRAEHQELKQRLAKLIPLADKFKEISVARQELPKLQLDLNALEEQLSAKLSQRKTLTESVQVWTERLAKREELAAEKLSIEQLVDDLQKEKHELGRQVAVLELRSEQLQQAQSEVEAKRAQVNTLIAEMNDYDFLAEAFGKKGIQAIIIENAVPEIEAEANKILSRLSDNQMHVALVTQTRTKSGNLVEALDIVVADDMGTRNYELYSGGEAFKINFAIRVALSRLLARRAGAKLQSLIVDEGFGSQDEVSRGRLIKALNAIQPDFARILVVTHIAEIKEMFPVQIQVQKTNGISSVNLVHAY